MFKGRIEFLLGGIAMLDSRISFFEQDVCGSRNRFVLVQNSNLYSINYKLFLGLFYLSYFRERHQLFLGSRDVVFGSDTSSSLEATLAVIGERQKRGKRNVVKHTHLTHLKNLTKELCSFFLWPYTRIEFKIQNTWSLYFLPFLCHPVLFDCFPFLLQFLLPIL